MVEFVKTKIERNVSKQEIFFPLSSSNRSESAKASIILVVSALKSTVVIKGKDNPVFARHAIAKSFNLTYSLRPSKVASPNELNLSDAAKLTMAGSPIVRLKKSGTTNPVHSKTLLIYHFTERAVSSNVFKSSMLKVSVS